VVAKLIATLPNIPQPSAEQLKNNPVYGRYRSQITAADLSPNGRVLMVMNYHSLFFYIRNTKDWSDIGNKTPEQLDFPWLPQAEAVAFAKDGKAIYIGSEQRPTPMIRFRFIK
jgi:hypothetical protein